MLTSIKDMCDGYSVAAKSATRFSDRNHHKAHQRPISHDAFFISCESVSGVHAGVFGLTGFLVIRSLTVCAPLFLYSDKKGGSSSLNHKEICHD